MKFNTFFAAAICAGALFTSCVDQTARERQLKYTHTSILDGDAFAAIQKVGEAALTGVARAEQVEASGDAASKEVAAKVKTFYAQFLSHLDSVATAFHVDFPIKGIPALEKEDVAIEEEEADSTVAVEDIRIASDEDYVHHAQHEVVLIKEQLARLTRNTNKDLQDFAKKQLSAVNELYTQIGGKEEAHGHAHH